MLQCRVGRATVLARLPGRVVPAPGLSVRLGFDPADLHLFGADGRRLPEGAHRMTRAALCSPTAATALAAPSLGRAQAATEISFLFPVAVGGPITKIIDGYARDFEAANPGIKVQPIYAGSYVDTLTKAQTALKAGDGPDHGGAAGGRCA